MASENQAGFLADLVGIARPEAQRIDFDFDTYTSADAIRENMKASTASKFISHLSTYLTEKWGWRATSKQTVMAEFSYRYAQERAKDYITRHDYARILRYIKQFHELQSDFRPLVFTRNEDGTRVPVGMVEAEEKAIKLMSAVRDKVNKKLGEGEDQDDLRQGQQELEEDEQDEQGEENNEQELKEQLQQEKQEGKIPMVFEKFWERYVQLREHTIVREVGAHRFDTIERRPYKAGAAMIAQGMPLEGIIWAMCMHWSPEKRRDLQISEYDVRTFRQDRRLDHMPPEFPWLDALYKARVNPWLIGDAGIGKTWVVGAMADHYGQPHCAIPLNRGTSPSAFNGRPKITNTSTMVAFLKAMADQDEEAMTNIARAAEKAGDVAISEFEDIFENGGHILLDEIDAADENLLMMVNMPLANARFANTAKGVTIEKHPDTLIWSASNTMGFGVSAGQGREYRARNALDFATIDRFRMGRVKMIGDIEDYRRDFEELALAYSELM